MKMHLSLHTSSYGLSDQSTKVKKIQNFKIQNVIMKTCFSKSIYYYYLLHLVIIIDFNNLLYSSNLICGSEA